MIYDGVMALHDDVDLTQLEVGDEFMATVNSLIGPHLQRVTAVSGSDDDGSFNMTCVDAEYADRDYRFLKLWDEWKQ